MCFTNCEAEKENLSYANDTFFELPCEKNFSTEIYWLKLSLVAREYETRELLKFAL